MDPDPRQISGSATLSTAYVKMKLPDVRYEEQMARVNRIGLNMSTYR